MERRENSKKSGEKHLSVGVKHKKNEKPDKQSYINDWLTGVSKQQDEGRRDETDLLEEYQPGEFDRSHDVKHKHKHKHKTNILTKISKQVSKKGLTKSDSSFIANWLSQLSQTIKGNQEHKDEAVIKHGRRKSQGLNQPKVRDIGTATSKENMKKKIRFRSEDSCIQEYESNIGHSKDRKEEEPKRDSHASNWFSKLPRIKIILEKGGVKHELGGVKHKQDEDDDDTYNEVKEPAAPAGDTRSEEKEYRAAERKGILKNPIENAEDKEEGLSGDQEFFLRLIGFQTGKQPISVEDFEQTITQRGNDESHCPTMVLSIINEDVTLQYEDKLITGEKLVSVPLQDVHKVFGSTVDCRGMGICTKDEEGAFFTVVLMSEREGSFGKKDKALETLRSRVLKAKSKTDRVKVSYNNESEKQLPKVWNVATRPCSSCRNCVIM